MKEYIFPLVSFVLIFHFQVFAEIKDSAMKAFEEKALEVERKLADWFYTIIDDLTDEQMQKVMYCEQGGIAEALAELSAITGEKTYMLMAKKFHHKEMMDPMGSVTKIVNLTI